MRLVPNGIGGAAFCFCEIGRSDQSRRDETGRVALDDSLSDDERDRIKRKSGWLPKWSSSILHRCEPFKSGVRKAQRASIRGALTCRTF